MPVKFKNLAAVAPHHPAAAADPAALSAALSAALGPVPGTSISVGMSQSTLRRDGVTLLLPVGAAHIANNAAAFQKAVETARTFLKGSTPAAAPAAPLAPAEAADAAWVTALAADLFPEVCDLHLAKSMYQPVNGTSASSVYRVCFMGTTLRGACRISGQSVSLRFTTIVNKAPMGAVRQTLERLGVCNSYEDRITVHAPMSGPYSDATAYEYRMLFGAFYAGLLPHLTSGFPDISKLVAS